MSVLSVAMLATGVHWRRRLMAPLESYPGLRAGLYGAVAAVAAGALTNDSGPVILLIGTVYLALAVGYVQSGPRQPARGQETATNPWNQSTGR